MGGIYLITLTIDIPQESFSKGICKDRSNFFEIFMDKLDGH